MEERNYKQIKFDAGEDLESAIKKLKSYNEPVYGIFNRQTLYSDESIDSAYKKVIGKTKFEFDKDKEEWLEKLKEEKKKHKEAIPELTDKWIEEGSKILDEKYIELWKKTVPHRLNDLYEGRELSDCLDIIKELNKGCKLSFAKEIIDNQGHSGMSFSLVCSMVESFCDRGEEFVNYLKTE